MEESKGERERPDEPSGDDRATGGQDSSRAEDEGERDEPLISSVREKIGEGEGNLRRRGEWYRRRTDA